MSCNRDHTRAPLDKIAIDTTCRFDISSNSLDRLNQERKRRTRVVRIFPNRESCLRLVSALAREQSDEWTSGRHYLDVRRSAEVHSAPLPTSMVAD